jgi:hypothetical protein
VAAGTEQAAAGLAGKTTRGMFADEILGVHLHALGSGGPPWRDEYLLLQLREDIRAPDLPSAGGRSGLQAQGSHSVTNPACVGTPCERLAK